MRIHTDTLTIGDIYTAAFNIPGVNVTVSRHGSRSHAHAFNVTLTGTSNRRPNNNTHDDDDDYAATWDEWGVFFLALFMLDYAMVAGSVKSPTYNGIADFNRRTGSRYVNFDISEQHRNHKWEFLGIAREHECDCGAIRRF